MSGMISTLPRRLALCACATLLALAFGFFYLRWTIDQGADLTDMSLLKWLLVAPLAAGLATGSVLSLLNRPPGWSKSTPLEAPQPMCLPEEAQLEPTLVQVLGLQWLSPVHRGDYPTQWHLLWAQGLAKPNADDPRLAEDDSAFEKVDVFRPLVSEAELPMGAFGHYLDKLLDQLRDSYHSDPSALYTVCAPKPEQPRSLDNIFISCAVPDAVDPVAARELVSDRVSSAFQLAKARPVVHVHAGGAEAGAAALKLAHDYLRSFPHHSAWVLSWDAPELPTPAVSENFVLSVLAGQGFDSGRHPLAWLGAATTVASAEPSSESTPTDDPGDNKAWSAAMRGAVANAGIEGFGHVVYDTTNSADGIAGLAQALTQVLPDFSIHRSGFDVGQTFRPAGACAVPLSMALAIARVAHLGSSAAVTVALPALQGVTALAVNAPLGESLPIKGTWFRAVTEDFAHMPWWGRRIADSSQASVLGLPT
jgi:hypothetical protein